MKRRKQRKAYSLRKQTVLYWVMLTLLILGIAAIYVGYIVDHYQKELLTNNQNMTVSYVRQLENEMNSLENYVKTTCVSDMHFKRLLRTNLSDKNWVSALYYLTGNLESKSSSMNYTGGLFLYDGRKNALRSRYSSTDFAGNSFDLNRNLKQYVRENVLPEENGEAYQIFTYESEQYLMYVFHLETTGVGYLINLNRWIAGNDFQEEETQKLFQSEDKNVVNVGAQIIKPEDLPAVSEEGEIQGNKMITSKKLGETGLSFYVVQRTGKMPVIWKNPVFYVLFIVGPLLLILVFWKIYRTINRILLIPIDYLLKRIREMKGMEESEEPQEELLETGVEFQTIYASIDDMIQEISDLEKEKYEKEMEANAAQLQYLRLQLNPHFFLNCLNIVDSLIATHKDEILIQGFLHSLAKHFRYVFRDQTSLVTLGEELEEAESYCNICMTRIGEPIFFQKQGIEEKWLSFQIPILTIQTFVENSIKYGKKAGKILSIRLMVSEVQDEEDTYLSIRISDNGDGYSEKQIKKLNEPVREFRYTSDNVGIDNIKYRIHLIWKEKAKAVFFNDKMGGAVSELLFPIEKEEKRRGTGNEHTGD